MYNFNDENVRFVFGIIDTLTDFDSAKRLEFCTKRVFLGKGISCIPPKDYKERFADFLNKIFS